MRLGRVLLGFGGTAAATAAVLGLTAPDSVMIRRAEAASTITVAADGTGDVRTVQAAVDRVPARNAATVTISIKKGTYTGTVKVPRDKPNIDFTGVTGNASDVVITESRAAKDHGAPGSATMTLLAPNLTVRNLTVRNGYDEATGGESQAVALYAGGDRQLYGNVRVLGNQETLLTWTGGGGVRQRQYFYDSYVEGDVDFIFGSGTAVFHHSTIHALSRGSASSNGYVTAASTYDSNPYGLLFANCVFSSNAPAGTFSLGRPWHPGDGQVLIRESLLGAHLRTARPWTDMGGFSWKTDARFHEYKNTGPGAGLNANRPQMSEGSAGYYTVARYVRGTDGWNPVPAKYQ